MAAPLSSLGTARCELSFTVALANLSSWSVVVTVGLSAGQVAMGGAYIFIPSVPPFRLFFWVWRITNEIYSGACK